MALGKQDRRQRVPFGVPRRKLNLDAATDARLKAEGKVPRWINDDDHGTRLMQAEEGGYDHVQAHGAEALGDAGEQQERDRRIKKLVGTHKDGSPKYAYLMAIKAEYYKEDQDKKEAANKQVDVAIRGGNPTGLGHHGVNPEQGKTYVKNIDYQP